MATIKSYTNIEQSKKLAEILPLESADMHYNNASIKGINYVDEYRAELMDYNTAQKVLSEHLINPMFGIIPCWSLASLLSVLPEYNLQRTDWGNKTEYKIVVNVNDDNYASKNYDNTVDTCVAMIIHLNELNLL